MRDRVVTAVRIRHHRILDMPHLMRLPTVGDTAALAGKRPIEAPRGLLLALTISGILWMAIAAIAM